MKKKSAINMAETGGISMLEILRKSINTVVIPARAKPFKLIISQHSGRNAMDRENLITLSNAH